MFTFDLSQQNFELRYSDRSRRLSTPELVDWIEQCEQNYYSGRPKDGYGRDRDVPEALVKLGRSLYRWLDGDEGWLRAALATGVPMPIAFQLNYSLEVQGLNPETDRIALGLAHLPWELLHDGAGFLLPQRMTLPPPRIVQQRSGICEAANRPLHLLLMATSPEKIQPVLSYEQEEANIVAATENQPLLLVVEESGSVAELANLVKFYADGYFDVFHLTGHGLIFTQADYGGLASSMQPPRSIAENTPCFITEDELGNAALTTVPDLVRAFGERMPRMIFLSGCHTGEVPDRGSVPSMAQALVQAGAQMVLGWARPVLDKTAIAAAQALYAELAAGSSVEQALKAAVAEMIRQKCPDWHLLRVYRDSRELKQLVTPMGTPKRERLGRNLPEQDFLDAQDQVKVAGAFAFVGRRRPLQRCLQVMKPTSQQVGVFIQGMGGLGKSTLAARLCRRVQAQRSGMQRVVLVGVVNEATLLQKLSIAYEQFPEIPEILNQPKLSLKGRLQNFIEKAEELDRPLLLVLDDFEQNIPATAIEDRTLRPITPAAEVLTALCSALAAMQQRISAMSRVIVTCRYACPFPAGLHLERLERMNSADVNKKCRLLPDYGELRRHPLYPRVLKIADGNPRLLEWLLKLLPETAGMAEIDREAILSRLEAEEQKFREAILAEKLLESLTVAERQFLVKLSVFHLPVTREMVAAVVPELQPIDRTLALSLLESATSPTEPEYRVTGILAPLLRVGQRDGLNGLTEAEWQTTQRQAAQIAYWVWWDETEGSTEERCLEMVRLALAGGEAEIAVKVGDEVATNWVNNSRFVEALDLCQQILDKMPNNHRILRGIARAEVVLGNVESANSHYTQALNHCPDDDLAGKSSILFNHATLIADQGDIDRALNLWQQSLEIYVRIGNVQGKAVTLHQMAGVIAQQGDIDRALNLWQQSLEIDERIGDVKGKAVTLHQMAGVIAQQGDIDRALNLWQQSLEIKERIGNVKGKAATLANMGANAYRQGDTERAIELLKQSAQALGQVRAYGDLVTAINNLDAITEKGNLIYLVQAVWLCTKVQAPLQQSISILTNLYNAVPQGDELEALLAAFALFLCNQRGQGHPQIEQLQELSFKLLSSAAGAQGIETQEALELWFTQQQLNDPAIFLPRLNQRLEAMIGDHWAFDPSPLRGATE
ncbi:MAG: tetratricopeptide repeat protein [Drouetiella hepatica Uher 2000/2452]|jgi:tetratricopeptide (TPR) repeat protein/DNA replication protein DnaC|uniref:Tetratricopeptide repeat protein n=1 Tax=Drouetiella hepatica Uher 2000/2452 TaxID=904376 RepID=A0A951UMC5_9CYAN|nr:tetratricopeptide repeat protein [Drouetiella hepatica Uher 2000/2452]